MRIILKNKEIYFDINRDSPVFVTSVNMSFSFNLFDSLCLSFFFFCKRDIITFCSFL
jgi:hypothetical protein